MSMPKYDLLYTAGTETIKGKVLMLLGVSYDGPVLYPVLIKSKEECLRVFGEEGSIYRGFCRAYDVDNTLQIYVMRVSGSEAECELSATVEIEDEEGNVEEKDIEIIKFKTFYGGSKYNNYYINVKEIGDTYYLIIEPDDPDIDSFVYSLDENESIEELIKNINGDMRKGLHVVNATSDYMEFNSSLLINQENEHKNFGFGEDGVDITKNDLYISLDFAYQLLEGFYIDVVCPIDARFDDSFLPGFYGVESYNMKYYSEDRDYLTLIDYYNENFPPTFHGQLIDFCSKQMKNGIFTHGVIGLTWIDEPGQVTEDTYYLKRLVEASALRSRYDIDDVYNGEEVDFGYYISITAGDLIYDGIYVENIAVTYAAMICTLDINNITTTNQKLPEGLDMEYEISTSEIIALSEIGVVTCRKNPLDEIVISNGVTVAKKTHELYSIADVRRIQFVLNALNDVLDEFKGESSRGIIKNGTLEKAVDNLLKYIENSNLIIDYTYDIMYNEYEGLALVSVSILTESSMEYIGLVSGVQ